MVVLFPLDPTGVRPPATPNTSPDGPQGTLGGRGWGGRRCRWADFAKFRLHDYPGSQRPPPAHPQVPMDTPPFPCLTNHRIGSQSILRRRYGLDKEGRWPWHGGRRAGTLTGEFHVTVGSTTGGHKMPSDLDLSGLGGTGETDRPVHIKALAVLLTICSHLFQFTHISLLPFPSRNLTHKSRLF